MTSCSNNECAVGFGAIAEAWLKIIEENTILLFVCVCACTMAHYGIMTDIKFLV